MSSFYATSCFEWSLLRSVRALIVQVVLETGRSIIRCGVRLMSIASKFLFFVTLCLRRTYCCALWLPVQPDWTLNSARDGSWQTSSQRSVAYCL